MPICNTTVKSTQWKLNSVIIRKYWRIYGYLSNKCWHHKFNIYLEAPEQKKCQVTLGNMDLWVQGRIKESCLYLETVWGESQVSYFMEETHQWPMPSRGLKGLMNDERITSTKDFKQPTSSSTGSGFFFLVNNYAGLHIFIHLTWGGKHHLFYYKEKYLLLLIIIAFLLNSSYIHADNLFCIRHEFIMPLGWPTYCTWRQSITNIYNLLGLSKWKRLVSWAL